VLYRITDRGQELSQKRAASYTPLTRALAIAVVVAVLTQLSAALATASPQFTQAVIDVTDLIAGKEAVFLAPTRGHAAYLPIIRAGERLYVPVPSAEVGWELLPDDISIALSMLGTESATLVEIGAGAARVYAFIGGNGSSGLAPAIDTVAVGLGNPSVVYGRGVRYEEIPYEVLSQREVRVTEEKVWLATEMPQISNPWASGKEVTVPEGGLAVRAAFYVFNSTERVFAGAFIRLVGGGALVTLRAYSESGGVIRELGNVSAYVGPGEAAVELPRWVIPNPFFGTPSKLVVVLEVVATDPGTRAELRIYAGGLGRTKLAGYLGRAYFRYVGGYAPTDGVDTVVGKIALLREPRSGDAVFATEPVPLLNGALSASIYAEVVGNVPCDRAPGRAELVAQLPHGELLISSTIPAYTGGTDPITGYPLYKAVINASLPPAAVSETLTRGADLVIVVRVRDAEAGDARFPYWVITNMVVEVRYRAPALSWEEAEGAGLMLGDADQANGSVSCRSAYCVTPSLRLDPYIEGWASIDREAGEVVMYAYLTYPAAA